VKTIIRSVFALAVALGAASPAFAWHCHKCCYCCPPPAPFVPAPFPTGVAPTVGAGFSMNMAMQGDASLAMLVIPAIGRLLGLTTGGTAANALAPELTRAINDVRTILDRMDREGVRIRPGARPDGQGSLPLAPGVERTNAEVKRLLDDITVMQKAPAPARAAGNTDERLQKLLDEVATLQKAPKAANPEPKRSSEAQVKQLLAEISALQAAKKPATPSTTVVNRGK
jgi:hypothetical protein